MGQSDSSTGRRTGNHWPPAEAEFPQLISIPEHELLGCIGRGSYGQVWLARNQMTGAYRAVKIVFRDSFEDQRPFERELTGILKFEPISRLHEGFVDVLQVGRNEEKGYFYYVMELGDDQVSGQNIDPTAYLPNTLSREISRRGRLSLQECLQLGLALTHALAELHKHGLVHRDIKPSNVIFVGGVPKLADIGLVATVHDTRSYVGTEGFIPPEGPGEPQADLFSLGKVLYEASTGRDRHDFPELPPEWSVLDEYPGLLELNEVILTACEPLPGRRYASAWDMHADLLVIVNGKSLKRLHQLERRLAHLKRSAGVAAIVLGVAGLIAYQVYREWRGAVEERQRQVSANITYGDRFLEEGDLFGALPYFVEALRLDSGTPAREQRHRLRIGSILVQCPKLTQMWFEPKGVRDGQFSPDDKFVLVAQNFGTAQMYDARTGAPYLHAFGPLYGLRCAVFSPDGRYILTTSESNTAIVWDSLSLTQIFSLPHTDKVYSGRFSRDSRHIVTACSDGVARVWNVQTGRLERALPKQTDIVAFADFSHDGRLIVTAGHDGTARIWRTSDGSAVTRPLRHGMWVNWAAFSPDDKRLVTACEDHKARVWEVSRGERILPDLRHSDAVETAEFSPDGRLVLTASLDGRVRLWRAADLEPLASNPILKHSDRVFHASFSHDGRQIISTCTDGTVRIWDLAGAAVPAAGKRRLFCRNGQSFLCDSTNGLRVYQTETERAVGAFCTRSSDIEKVELTSAGDFVLTCSANKSPTQTNWLVQTWSVASGKPVGEVSVPELFTGAVLSDTGRYVATYRADTLQLWDLAHNRRAAPPLKMAGIVQLARFGPTGARLLALAQTNIYMWNTESGKLLFAPRRVTVPIVFADFSDDGRRFVTCSSDLGSTKCSAQVWDSQTGNAVGEPLRHDDGVLGACFSHDGKWIATASEDFTARVWQSATGRQLGLPLTHGGQVWGVAFSPGAEWVATASSDHTVRVWDPQNGSPLTPPLRHLVALQGVQFVGRSALVARDLSGLTYQWPLQIEDRPIAALEQLAELLAGGEFVSPVNPTKGIGEPAKVLWQRLRTKYPETFVTSAEEVARWHEFMLKQSESEQDWSAGDLHPNWQTQSGQTLRPVGAVLARVQPSLDRSH